MMNSPTYPQYFGSPSAGLEFIVESDDDLAEHAAWMAAHSDAFHIRWKDGIPIDDEKALKEAAIKAIVGDWVANNVEVETVDGKMMFRIVPPCETSSPA